MVQYIVTPWRNREELLQARQRLYGKSLNEEERRHAVAQISVWMQRGNCPHLVESTAILTSAILNDVPGNSAYCVRAAYSAAFCRFVTGLLDSHQTKTRKLSMYSIAKTVGLPATYVELRHQATHEELPSLSKLRTAAQKSLKWIWDYYWSSLSDEKRQVDADGCRNFVEKLVRETDEKMREKLEKALESWDSNQLMKALDEIQGCTNDPKIVLRVIQLQGQIMRSGPGSPEDQSMSKPASGPNELEQIKAELVGMKSGLTGLEGQSQQKKRKHAAVSVTVSGKSWEMWTGPWVPKPIGVV